MSEKIKRMKKLAEIKDASIEGWTQDIDAGILWAEYSTDGPVGIIVGISLITGNIYYRD